jgi:single-stranded-DNA-specific exonuclease
MSELSHLRLTPLSVQLLANRGLIESADIDEFLRPPDVSGYPDPSALTGMPEAVDRISQAIESSEPIVVYGDFDADGVTSTALLTLALRHFGAKVEPYVPHRERDGYGLNAFAIRELAEKGTKLLITVDCGISGREEVAAAKRAGMDVIVTDHHHLPSDLPEAAACINPKQFVAGCECYRDLAGVGVAYQLVRALVKKRGKPPTLRNIDLLALVAIGTVADVVPLRGANRSLVQQGVAAIPHHSLPGLRTMLEFAHVDVHSIDTDKIGYTIGPRLNAAGRMDDASVAYRLLMTPHLAEAKELAQKLNAHNRARQASMNNIIDQARQRARALDERVKLILLADENWPSGVVGLVAGRIAEEFGRPALILSKGPEESRGSARSGPYFNIVGALEQLGHMLIKYGGHEAAAGFTVRTERIAELNEALCRMADEQLDQSKLEPVIRADAEISIDDVNDANFDAIGLLAPFGSGNPTPLFMARDVRVADVLPMGDGSHLKLLLSGNLNGARPPVEAVAFRTGQHYEMIRRKGRVDLLFSIERREWKGDVHLQLKVRDMRI